MTGIKILHVGAHEELIMNYYRHFKSGRICFDYVLRKTGVDFRFKNDPCFDGRLHYITPMQTSVWLWIKELRSVIRSDRYTHVHLHLGWASIYGLIASVGLGKKLISHNHSYYKSSNPFRALMRKPLRFLINRLSDYMLACSVDSGKQLFPNGYTLLPNAIDYSRFQFKPINRVLIRGEFCVADDVIVFGHVGNFTQPKNHSFLIKIFSEIQKRLPKSVLFLVGADYGTLDAVRADVRSLGLEQQVVFVGDRSDVDRLLCAFDIFLFPSLFEGLPLALLEAQVSGLPCAYTSSISVDAVISQFCVPCDLKNDAEVWAVRAINLCAFGFDSNARIQRAAEVLGTFNVANVAHQLENFYLSTTEFIEPLA